MFASSIPKNGLLLREHVRQKRGWYRIKKEDHPQQMPLQVSQLLWRAGRAGTHIGTLCNLIYSQQGEVGVRRILGVLALAKKYGTAAVDEACAAALEMGDIPAARAHLEAAIRTAEAIGDPHPTPSENLGWVLRAEHDLDGARSRFEEALRTGRRIGRKRGMAGAISCGVFPLGLLLLSMVESGHETILGINALAFGMVIILAGFGVYVATRKVRARYETQATVEPLPAD